MRFSTIFTTLFCPYIAHERTAQNLDYVSSLVALRSFSYWAPSLPKWRFTQERRAIERFQRAMRPALTYREWQGGCWRHICANRTQMIRLQRRGVAPVQPFSLCSFFLISLMSEPLRIRILSVRLSLFALFLIERHCSQNQGLLKSEEQFQRSKCPALVLRVQILVALHLRLKVTL